jgi:hypothetical protein
MNSNPGSTQILTRHYGTKSHTISQLTNSGTMPTRQVPIVQLLWVIETPVDGVVVLITAPSNNPDRIVGLH